MIAKEKTIEKLFDVYDHMRKDREEKMKQHMKVADDHKPRKKLSHTMRSALVLLKDEGQMNQRTLAIKMRVSAQAVSELIKKLEQEGYIEKTSGLFNNENYIGLTEKGIEKAIYFKQRISKHADELLSELSQDEIENLYYLLDKIIQTKFSEN